MADVFPFNGVLYNKDKVNIADVVAPPYDVISPEEQQKLYDKHPNNIIRLVLGLKDSGDNEFNNPHTRAAKYSHKWSEDGILVNDTSECFYLEASEFKIKDHIMSRLGLIARVKIEPFEKRIIMPHEKTFSKVKEERLGLIKESQMNFSCIFGLYLDNNSVYDKLENVVEIQEPWVDFVDYDGLRHRLWRIEDSKFNGVITNSLKDERLIIADGHHRYETALNYRNYLAKSDSNFDSNHPANYVMMYLSSMEDPGLVVKPTHRALKSINLSSFEKLLNESAKYFDIISYGDSCDSMLDGLKSSINSSFGLCYGQPQQYYLFVLKLGVMSKLYSEEIPESLRELDVTVLTRLVFIELLGLDQSQMDDTSSFSYISDTDKAIESVRNGMNDLVFILNPTRVEQVRRVAEDGLIMPRKSTFFYPKVVSGLVQNSLKFRTIAD